MALSAIIGAIPTIWTAANDLVSGGSQTWIEAGKSSLQKRGGQACPGPSEASILAGVRVAPAATINECLTVLQQANGAAPSGRQEMLNPTTAKYWLVSLQGGSDCKATSNPRGPELILELAALGAQAQANGALTGDPYAGGYGLPEEFDPIDHGGTGGYYPPHEDPAPPQTTPWGNDTGGGSPSGQAGGGGYSLSDLAALVGLNQQQGGGATAVAPGNLQLVAIIGGGALVLLLLVVMLSK